MTAARTATGSTGNNTSVTGTLPTGTAAGDLLLCHLVVSQGGTSFTQPTITTPTGWLLIPTGPGSAANPLVSQSSSAGIIGAWYYRYATGADPAPSWTFNTSGVNFKHAWTVEAYSAAGSGAPKVITGTGATGGAAVATNTTSTGTASTVWYAETYGSRSTTNATYTTPSGMTLRSAVFGSGGAAADLLFVDSNGTATGTVGGDTTTAGTASSWQVNGLILFPSATSASSTLGVTFTASGSVTSSQASQFTAGVAFTASGTVSGANPSLFVQQQVRPTYTIQLVDAPHLGSSSAVVGDLSQAAGKALTLSTPEGSNLAWTMPGNHPESLLTSGAGVPGLWEMCCDAIVWRDPGTGPVKLWRGRVTGGNDASDSDGTSIVVSWTAVDYKALFASRLILDADTLTFAASTDVAAIAWTLVNQNQAKTNGNMGITKSTDGWTGGGTANTGKTFSASFVVTAGTDLKTALDTLLAGDTTAPAGAAAGFDWWIDPNLQMHIKSRSQTLPNPPGQGVASTFVADYQGTVRSFSRTALVDQYGNVERGDGGTGTTPTTVTSPTLATDPAGRVERAATVNVNTTQTTAQQNALIAQVTAEALYVANVPASSYTLVLAPGVWDPSILSVGDNVQTVIQAGRLNVTGYQRVLSLKIDVSDDGGEQVTLTTQRPDATDWQVDTLVKLAKRIRGVELRS